MLPARVSCCPTLLVWIKRSPAALTVPTVSAGPFRKPNQPPALPVKVPTIFALAGNTVPPSMPRLTLPAALTVRLYAVITGSFTSVIVLAEVRVTVRPGAVRSPPKIRFEPAPVVVNVTPPS